MSKEPRRLMQSEPGPLADEIAALRGRLPSPESMAALTERLTAAGASIEPPLPKAPRLVETQRARPTGVLESSLKIVVVALLAGGALVGAALWLRHSDVPSVPPAAQVPPALGAPIFAAPAAAVPTTSAPTAALNRSSAASAASAALPASSAGRADSSAAPPSDAPSSVLPAPPASAAAAAVAASSERRSDPARSERPAARSRITASPSPSDAKSTEGLADNTVVPSEVELLKDARSALGADPARAFALTERCRAQYPSGSFAQEREFIAISALYRMGRGEEARSRLSLFKMHYPSSAYLPALNRLLGEP